MRYARTVGIGLAVVGLLFATWAHVSAQRPSPRRSSENPSASPHVATSNDGASQFQPLQGAIIEPLNPFGSLPSPSVPNSGLAVKIEVDEGLVLKGRLPPSLRFQCATAFGQANIPMEAIRGLRSLGSTTPQGLPAGSVSATVVLMNNDSLTVTLQTPRIALQTRWGQALIDVPHLVSLVREDEAAAWVESDGRWALVPIAHGEAVDAPQGSVEEAAQPANLPPTISQQSAAEPTDEPRSADQPAGNQPTADPQNNE